MNTADLVIRSTCVVTPLGVHAAAVYVTDGVISRVAGPDDISAACQIVDVGDAVVMPGVVDTHVHVNEPGRTEWEGFFTATRAAAAGGTTALVDMPLNSIPPTTTVDALCAKRASASDGCWVDVGFWGGVVPGNTSQIAPLLEAGVLGLKCFMVDSGVPEFPYVGERDLREAMAEIARLDGLLIAHAELEGPIEAAAQALSSLTPSERRSYASYLRSRPPEAENEAIELLIRLSREFGTRVHIVHLSSADALPILRRARDEGVRVSAETCLHYLTFAAEDIPDGATEFKCAPPIRERDNRERLWEALDEGLVDFVVTDHSPCTPDLKRREEGDFALAWGGISSLQLGLSAMWTEARRRGFGLDRLAEWMCCGPARLVGLEGRKGSIAPGCDADLVVFDPDARVVVDPAALHHRHKVTPYAGRTLEGAVRTTYVRGHVVYDQGELSASPWGELILRRISS